jgi:hypothetical protein
VTNHVIAISLVFTALCSTASAKPVDASLRTSEGEKITLSLFRDKPILLFYEDKDSTNVNRPLKDKLKEWASGSNLYGLAHVFAVTNLSSYNFFPARNIALGRVRALERKLNVKILADLEGVMSAEPWSLPTKSSTVVVISPSGEVVFQKTGACNDDEIKTVITTLEHLIAD